MSARDNPRSTRSREDIDFDAEVRTKVQVLRARMLDAFGGDQYGEVVAELARIALDPRTSQKTRVVALTAYARATGSLVAEGRRCQRNTRTAGPSCGGACGRGSRRTGRSVPTPRPRKGYRPDARLLTIEDKDDIRARLGRNPDRADAIALAVCGWKGRVKNRGQFQVLFL